MGSVGQYTQGWLSWAGSKANTNWSTRNSNTDRLGLGECQSSSAQNDEISWDVWLDTGAWKMALVYAKTSTSGIFSVQLDGVEQGTIDAYNASTTLNNYTEITGISVTVAGLKTFKLKMATKNASSSSYFGIVNSWAWIRTSGTSSIPAGMDTPGYTWIYVPWMGTKSNTNWATRTQASTLLAGGKLDSSGAQNDLITFDIWLDSGTYKIGLIYTQSTNIGIFNITGINGTQTIDGYNGVTSHNNYSEVTGITVASAGIKTVQIQMATKNASASAYGAGLNSVAIIRTGA